MAATDECATDTGDSSCQGQAEFVSFLRSFPCLYPHGLEALIGRFRREWKDTVGMNISHPCSRSSDSPNCWILRYLSPLNNCLHQANVGVSEHTPGYLTLSRVDAYKAFDDPERGYIVGSFVALFLVKMHQCVQHLELCSTALVYRYPDTLASSIAAAPSLGGITLHPSRDFPKYSFSSVIRALRHCSELEHLDLSGFTLSNRNSDELAQLLPDSRIRSLIIFLDLSPRAAKRLLNAINNSRSLKTLSVGDFLYSAVNLTKLLASALATNKTLRSLSVRGGSTQTAESVLKAMKSSALVDLTLHGRTFPERYRSRYDLRDTAARLRSLELSSHRGFGSLCACFLASSLLQSFSVLEKIDLSYTGVGDTGAMSLAEALLSNNTLKQLNLEGCPLTALSVRQFVSSLARNTTVECVRLGAVRIDETLSFSPVDKVVGRLVTLWNTCGTEELTRTLRSECCTVTAIELAWTDHVNSSCVSDLFQAMCENDHISELCVHHCSGLDIAPGLTALLRTTQTLRRLRVSDGFISSELVEEVLYALSENHTVTEAEFVDFALYPNEGGSAVRAVLRLNKQLTSLTFRAQELDESALRGLAGAMMDNYTMTKLRCIQLSMYSGGYALILDILNRNMSLLNRALQFLRTGALDCLDAFRKLCDSYAFAANYAASEKLPLQQVRDTIAAALDLHGRGTE